MRQVVIDDQAIYTARRTDGGRVIRCQELDRKIYNVTDIVEICRPLKIESVWVMPGSQLSQAAKNWFFAPVPGYKIWYDPILEETEDIYTKRFVDDPDSDHVSYASARREKTGNQYEADINIMYPEWGVWCEDFQGQHWNTPGPRDLLATVLYLSDAFGVAACISPGNMGKRLMKEHSKYRLTERVDCSHIPFSDMTMDMVWMREPTPEERKMRFLHQYDKNRQYTGAAQSVRVGIGDPEFVTLNDGFRYHKDCVGIWRVDVDMSASQYDNKTLPCPINPARQWVSTDLIEAARKIGVRVLIHEGYVWRDENTAVILDKWAKHMWQASAALRDNKDNTFPHAIARENAYRTSKLMSNATIGRLNREYSQELYRPDINRLIIQKARANQTYTLEKYNKFGYQPAHVYRDALYFFSNEADPAKAVPGILQYERELRGYKHEHTYNNCSEVQAAFAVGVEKSAGKGHNLLKKLRG